MNYFISCPILNDIIKFCITATTKLETPTGRQFLNDSSKIVQFGYRTSGRLNGTKRTRYFVTLYKDVQSYDFEISYDEYNTALRLIEDKTLSDF